MNVNALRDVLRQSGYKPTLIVLRHEDAFDVKRQMDQCTWAAREPHVTGPLFGMHLDGVSIAVADVSESYVLFEDFTMHPIIVLLPR